MGRSFGMMVIFLVALVGLLLPFGAHGQPHLQLPAGQEPAPLRCTAR